MPKKIKSIWFWVIEELLSIYQQDQEDIFGKRFASLAIEWKMEFESERSAFGASNSAISPAFITITRL